MRLLAVTTIVVSSRPPARCSAATFHEGNATAAPSSEAQRAATRGLVLQQQARVSGNPALYPQAEQALERALRLDPRNASRAARALGARRVTPSLSRVARPRAAGAGARARRRRGLRPDRRREPRARPLPRGVRRVRPDGGAEAVGERLRPDLVRPRADRRSRRRARGDGARRRLGRRGRAGGVDADADRQPAPLPAQAGRGEGALPRGAGVRAGLRRRAAAGSPTSGRRTATSRAPLFSTRARRRRRRCPSSRRASATLLAELGREAEAERAWKRADELERLFAANGGRNLLETAEFDLNHDRNFRSALDRARRGRAERPSVEGDHVLAWALYKNDRCAEARVVSLRSLRLGTLDVDGLYHHSLIERCLGNSSAAARYRPASQAARPAVPRRAAFTDGGCRARRYMSAAWSPSASPTSNVSPSRGSSPAPSATTPAAPATSACSPATSRPGERLRLRPRVLVDVSEVTTATTVLGTPVSMPLLVAPTAFQRLAHPDGEPGWRGRPRRPGR